MFGIIKESDSKYLILDTDDMTLDFVDKKIVKQCIGNGTDFLDLHGYVIKEDSQYVIVYKVTGVVPDFELHCMSGRRGHGMDKDFTLPVTNIVTPYYNNGRLFVKDAVSGEVIFAC